MNLAAKYTRTDLIEDGEIQKWRGTNRSTGAQILLYLYTGELDSRQAPADFASASIEQRLAQGHARLESGVFGLSPCVVCAEQPSAASSKPEVLAIPSMGAAAPQVAAEADTPIPPIQDEGDFTSLFGVASEVAAPAESARFVEPEKPLVAPEPETPVTASEPSEPGGFTSLFLAANQDNLDSGSPAASSPASAEKPPAAEVPAASPHSPAIPPSAAAAPRGAFTEMYMAIDPETLEASSPESTVKPQTPASAGQPASAPQPASQAPADRGAFTELYMAADPAMFEAAKPTSAESTQAPPSTGPEQGAFTEMYLAVNPDIPEPVAPAVEPALPTPGIKLPEPAATAPESGEAPGEFTRMFMPDTPAGGSGEPSSPVPASAGSSLDDTSGLEVPKQAELPAAAASSGDAQAGEFTQMFQTGSDMGAADSNLEATPPVVQPGSGVPSSGVPAPAAAPATPASFSSASPAKGPIRFAPSDSNADPNEPAKPRSPLSTGTFSQTYISTDEMPVMRHPDEAAAPAEPVAPAGPPPPASAGEAPGEFTMLFASPQAEEVLPPEPPLQMAPPAQAYEAPATMPMSVAPPIASPEPVAPEPAPPAAAAFPPPAAPAAPAPSAESSGPGEFTKFFQPGELDSIRDEVMAKRQPSPTETPSSVPVREPAAPMPPASRPGLPPASRSGFGDAGSAPGEFTKMFSAADLNLDAGPDPAASGSVAPPPTGQLAMPPASKPEGQDSGGAPGEFTKMFSAADLAPGLIAGAPNPPAATPQANVPAASTESAPTESAGEFTMMFRSADLGLAGPPEGTSAPPDLGSGPGGSMDAPPLGGPPMAGGPSGPGAPGAGSGSSGEGGASFTQYFRAADEAADFGSSPSSAGSDPFGQPPQSQELSGQSSFPETPAQSFEPAKPQGEGPSYGSGFSSGGATQFFQTPAASAPQSPSAPPESIGPGEYTRMISGEDVRLAMERGPEASQGGGASAGGGSGGTGLPLPGMSGPRVSGPYVQGPSVSSSGVSGPYVQKPTMQGPHMSTPHVSTPHLNAPHISAPHMSGPTASSSGVSGPQMSGPHMSGPSVSGAGMSSPPLQAPQMGGAPPAAPMASAPVPTGGAPAAGGSSASKIIIFVTIIVTIIAVSLVLMVAYFALKG